MSDFVVVFFFYVAISISVGSVVKTYENGINYISSEKKKNEIQVDLKLREFRYEWF